MTTTSSNSSSKNSASTSARGWRGVFSIRTAILLLLAVAMYGAGWARGRFQLTAEMSEYEKESEIRFKKMVTQVRDRFGESKSQVD